MAIECASSSVMLILVQINSNIRYFQYFLNFFHVNDVCVDFHLTTESQCTKHNFKQQRYGEQYEEDEISWSLHSRGE